MLFRILYLAEDIYVYKQFVITKFIAVLWQLYRKMYGTRLLEIFIWRITTGHI